MTCKNCQFSNASNMRFCGGCGRRILANGDTVRRVGLIVGLVAAAIALAGVMTMLIPSLAA